MKIKLFAVGLLTLGSAATITVMAQAQPAPHQANSEEIPMDWAPYPEDILMRGAMFAERVAYIRETYDSQRARYALSLGLAAQQTLIGITPEQQAAWQAYASAVIAMVPDKTMVDGAVNKDGDMPDAFGRAEHIADSLIAYQARAETLKQAIANLRKVLTPLQLESARVPRFAGLTP